MYEYRNRTRSLFSNPKPNIAGFYGSTRAASFIRDARAKSDSVDIITIGDSNAGSPGGYGYTVGVHRVMSYQYGIDLYATPLLPGGNFLNTFTFSGLSNGMALTGTALSTTLDNVAGGSGSTGNARLMTLYTGDSEINGLVTHLGFNSTNSGNDGTTMLPKPNAWQWMPVVIPTGTIWTGSGGTANTVRLGPGVPISEASPLNYGAAGNGATNLQYRCVVGTFNASGGQFKLTVMNTNSFGLNVRSANFISTQTVGGGYGYKTETLNFTTQNTATPGVYCGWDGANSGVGNATTGPFACLWASVIERSKLGYSVSNLTYHGGNNGTGLADRIEGMDKNLDLYLKEIRERQVEAGGSGRVIVFVSYGINTDLSPTPEAAWTNAADRIKARIQARWVSTGGSLANLAFMFVPSHSVPSGTVSPWDVNRTSVVGAAGAWATSNLNDGSGTCVIDSNTQYTSVKLTKGPAPAGSLYDSGGQAHLNGTTSSGLNGYDAVTGAVFNTMLAALYQT
jgi:hypothetical protein